MQFYTECAQGEHPRILPDYLCAEEGGFSGPAAERLAAYERLHATVLKEQEHISAELAGLRAEGRTKTAKFGELMGKKLTNSHILTLMRFYGIE